MRIRIAHVEFAPLEYLDEPDRAALADKLDTEREVERPLVFDEHPVLVGRGTLAPSLPAGTLAWSYLPGSLDANRERAGLEEMTLGAKRAAGRRRFRIRDVVEHNGLIFLRRPALVALAAQRDARAAMLRAALGLLDMLMLRPDLVRVPRKRLARPLVHRQPGERGPAWTADEDARLREVFAPNAPRPSKREWGWLLAHGLGGKRTRKAVLMRVERLELRKRRR
jgi:hypothetical protein